MVQHGANLDQTVNVDGRTVWDLVLETEIAGAYVTIENDWGERQELLDLMSKIDFKNKYASLVDAPLVIEEKVPNDILKMIAHPTSWCHFN